MTINTRFAKAETAIITQSVRVVACTWHALSELDTREPLDPADIFTGGCHECGGEIPLNAEGTTAQERELSAELFAVGTSNATLTDSPRSWAALMWLARRGKKLTARADETYKQALIDENGRRSAEQWKKHLETVSDEMLATMNDLAEATVAELEVILWPARRNISRAKKC